jgi:hypothetical protein
VHPAAQFAIGMRPDHQVEVVRHETVSDQSHRQANRALGEGLPKRDVIVGLVNDRSAPISPVEDIVDQATLRHSR